MVKDRLASNLHLRVYRIDIEDTEPLVYVKDLSSNGTFVTRASASTKPANASRRRLLRSSDPPLLLEHGDVLRIGRSFRLRYESCYARAENLAVSRTRKQQDEMKCFSRSYVVSSRVIGPGTFGTLHLAHDRVAGTQVACKIVDRRNKKAGEVSKQMREVELLQNISHPNIVQIKQAYVSSETIYIFQELLTAGDLFSYFVRNDGMMSDTETAVIIRQVLQGVEYLHARNIVHRDLKLENILMTSLTPGARVVISDFGSAASIKTVQGKDGMQWLQRIRTFAGTINYVAPEVYEYESKKPTGEGYTTPVDMFSIGIVTYTLLGGTHHPPMEHGLVKGIKPTLLRFIEFNSAEALIDLMSRPVSGRPRDLMLKLLSIDPAKRPTATEALRHPWFTSGSLLKDFKALEKDALKYWYPRPTMGKLIQRLPEPFIQVESSNHLSAVVHPILPPPREEYLDDLDTLISKKAVTQQQQPPIHIAEDQCGQGPYVIDSQISVSESVSTDSVAVLEQRYSANPAAQYAAWDRNRSAWNFDRARDSEKSPSLLRAIQANMNAAELDSNYAPDTWRPPVDSSSLEGPHCSVKTTVSDDGTIMLATSPAKRPSPDKHLQNAPKKRGMTRSEEAFTGPSSEPVMNVVLHRSI